MASKFIHRFFPFLIANPIQGERWYHIKYEYFVKIVEIKSGYVTYTRTDLPFQANQYKLLNEFKEEYERMQ